KFTVKYVGGTGTPSSPAPWTLNTITWGTSSAGNGTGAVTSSAYSGGGYEWINLLPQLTVIGIAAGVLALAIVRRLKKEAVQETVEPAEGGQPPSNGELNE
ncbi:MAG: hypothetical protein ACPL07_04995, partial [Candidatus Bathyarchaeia archaeon]